MHECESLSYREIATKVGVSYRTVASWAEKGAPDVKKGPWEKGIHSTKLQQKQEAALEAEAERHGITKAKVFAKVAELIDAKSVAVITTQGAVSLCPMLPGSKVSKDGKADFMGIQYDVVPDRKSQIEVTKLAADVLGMKKVELGASDDLRGLFQSMRAA